MEINDSHLIGFSVGIFTAIAMAYIVPRKKKDHKFKKGDKRTTLLARLGGYARWDRDGKRYGDKKKTTKKKK